MAHVFSLAGRDISPRKGLQAGLIEAVGQLWRLRELLQRAGLVEAERADAGTSQHREMPADAEPGTDVTGERADICAARTVNIDIHVNDIPVTDIWYIGTPPHTTHLKAVNPDSTRLQFDGATLPNQLVGTGAVDFYRTDRRRDLFDLAPPTRERGSDLTVRYMRCRN